MKPDLMVATGKLQAIFESGDAKMIELVNDMITLVARSVARPPQPQPSRRS